MPLYQYARKEFLQIQHLHLPALCSRRFLVLYGLIAMGSFVLCFSVGWVKEDSSRGLGRWEESSHGIYFPCSSLQSCFRYSGLNSEWLGGPAYVYNFSFWDLVPLFSPYSCRPKSVMSPIVTGPGGLHPILISLNLAHMVDLSPFIQLCSINSIWTSHLSCARTLTKSDVSQWPVLTFLELKSSSPNLCPLSSVLYYSSFLCSFIRHIIFVSQNLCFFCFFFLSNLPPFCWLQWGYQ